MTFGAGQTHVVALVGRGRTVEAVVLVGASDASVDSAKLVVVVVEGKLSGVKETKPSLQTKPQGFFSMQMGVEC